jgi:arylsulfatase A-like enzyme
VHAPLETIEKYRARFKSIQDPKRRAFAAVLSAMDDGIGRVLGTLRTHKLEQDTLIFFLSDNGGPTSQTSSGNGPLRGSKGEVWEGGIRVPFLMQWKNHLPAGQVYSQPVIALDILPTAVAAAGGVMQPEARLDGVNLLPHLTGKLSGPPHEALFWRFGSQAAVRVGDWKLVLIGGEAPALFNLAEDIGETKDLASRAPERVKQIKATYDAWNAQLMEPRWGRGARPAGKQQRQ